ncbi:DUF4269 domain-containing protein [Cohnella sp. CFH 77786]|uniref:DUF4269 domain-containing protein n=1 Tax=Cohnella sp. CFH 77786 TaxID=2662265 RepID=UPI001C60B4CD|nr:DUF4269 domain-containing protein [Cohnella sp. CFH 77786]MBW5446522.1 DUF4269 domain-containing protein [Cohnella sp. CFH 77786]
MTDFTKIEYLNKGNSIQTAIYLLLVRHRLLDLLVDYNPVFVGTIPIGINVAGSDLDIICEVYDFERFEKDVTKLFSKYERFVLNSSQSSDASVLTANFDCEGWPVEIYGQSVPSTEQNGFKHMVIEDRLLRLFGTSFRNRIVSMKMAGLKTEPAFAQALNLPGDPYAALLELYHWTDDSLMALIRGGTRNDRLD